MEDELLDIVDDADNIIGKANRKEIYGKQHQHRIVHVLVFNDKGEMGLQLRPKNARFCPNGWSTTVGGHVLSGETYEQAAIREMAEELGIKCKVTLFFKDMFVGEDCHNKILGTFKAIYDGPFKPNPREVEKIEFFSLDQIQEMINRGEKFHPELIFLLKKHYNIV